MRPGIGESLAAQCALHQFHRRTQFARNEPRALDFSPRMEGVMGLYDRYILPVVLNAAMSTKPIRYQRKKVVPRAQGRVLEIGFGAGHNLPFYDASKVTHLWALEPSK